MLSLVCWSTIILQHVKALQGPSVLPYGSSVLARNSIQSIPLPTCTVIDGNAVEAVPPAEATPQSWAEAVLNPISLNSGDCYSVDDAPHEIMEKTLPTPPGENRVWQAACCCAFWNVKPLNDVPSQSGDCVQSFGTKSTNNPKIKDQCSFVIAISGHVDAYLFPKIPCILDSYEQYMIVDEHVCAVAFVSVDADLEVSMQSIFDGRAWIKDYEIESAIVDDLVDDSTQRCTGGMFNTYSDELRERHHYVPGKAKGSMAPMFRKIWMAHLMARQIAPRDGSGLIARSRIDYVAMNTLDWGAALAQASAQHGVLVPELLARNSQGYHAVLTRGVSPMQRCVVDDIFAVGLPEAMDGYASVYPDFKDFARVLLIHRNDQHRFVSERVLTQHLHYRNVSFTTTDVISGGIHPDTRGCNATT